MRIINNVPTIKARLRKASQLGVKNAAHKTMAYSNANEVPMDTGRLINSGYYELWEKNSNVVAYKLSYGGSEGLAGMSPFATRLFETLESVNERNSISRNKGTIGQLTYAKRWHQLTPKGGFQNDRKNQYLTDPMENQFPDFLMSEIESAWTSIGIVPVKNVFNIIDSMFVPDEVMV